MASGEMGAVCFSIDRNLVELLKDALSLRVFVETGTFEGDTVARIEDLFDTVLSVEITQECYQRARGRFRGVKHVKPARGDSPTFLRRHANHRARGPCSFGWTPTGVSRSIAEGRIPSARYLKSSRLSAA